MNRQTFKSKCLQPLFIAVVGALFCMPQATYANHIVWQQQQTLLCAGKDDDLRGVQHGATSGKDGDLRNVQGSANGKSDEPASLKGATSGKDDDLRSSQSAATSGKDD